MYNNCLINIKRMINFTHKKHQKSQETRQSHYCKQSPSKLTIKFIMGYAAALIVYDTINIGKTNIMLN